MASMEPLTEQAPFEFDHGIRETQPLLGYVGPLASSTLTSDVLALDVIGQDDAWEERWEFTMGDSGDNLSSPVELVGCTFESNGDSIRELQNLVDAIAAHDGSLDSRAAVFESDYELPVIRPDRFVAQGFGAPRGRESAGNDLLRLH